MKRWMICTVMLGMLLVRCSGAWARTWTDKSGKHKVEAELVEVKDGKVLLKKTGDGKIVAVPLNRLSVADRRYLSSLDNADSPSKQSVSPPCPSGEPVKTKFAVKIHASIGG